MNTLYEDDVLSLEWICKVYNESRIEENNIFYTLEDKILSYCDKLLKLQPESAMGLITKALLLFHENKTTEAANLLKKGKLLNGNVTT